MVRQLVVAVALSLSAGAGMGQAPQLSALSRLPVREVTVFKDGHAYVIHEGRVPVETDGEVRMDYLPTPILGTFWAYSADPNTPARTVTAGIRRVVVERTALTVQDLIAANPGAQVMLREKGGKPYSARIVGFLTRSAAEQEATDPPNSDPKLPERSNVLLVQTERGVLTVPADRIDSVAFKNPPKDKLAQEEFRNVLSLAVPGVSKGSQANVGLMYVQRGIRWIPSYQVNIDGKGTARVRMQATLINEMLDLRDATVHLVIGVPSFAYEHTPDPMSLQNTFAQLSPYFDKSSRASQVLSNALMGQAGRMSERTGAAADGGADAMPDVVSGQKSEDYYVFTVKGVTLKKGARMVVPVADFTIPYKDVYTLVIPYSPPREAMPSAPGPAEAAYLRAMASPKVLHQLRLTNNSAYPLTTAPALILSDGRVLAQGMLTYTAKGASSDLSLTTAVDIRVKRTDTETGRIPSAMTLNNVTFGRTDSAGKITLTNYRAEDVDVEVTRYVVGHVDRAEAGGEAVNLDPYGDETAGDEASGWRIPWPEWWSQVNGFGRFTWKVSIQPGQSLELGYAWHHFWR